MQTISPKQSMSHESNTQPGKLEITNNRPNDGNIEPNLRLLERWAANRATKSATHRSKPYLEATPATPEKLGGRVRNHAETEIGIFVFEPRVLTFPRPHPRRWRNMRAGAQAARRAVGPNSATAATQVGVHSVRKQVLPGFTGGKGGNPVQPRRVISFASHRVCGSNQEGPGTQP